MKKMVQLAGASLLALATTAPALAQDGATGSTSPSSGAQTQAAIPIPGDDGSQAEPATNENDIIVTAQRRETQLQETPIAITALGGDALQARGVDTPADLGIFVPGADFSTNGGATSITIRGVGSDGLAQPKDDPSVAAHIDGVYLARPASLSAQLYDIERVEVLRGPQGTLYGRNATGGALNILAKRPTDRLEAGGEASYGNYDAIQLRGYANLPISDTLSFRASAIYDKRDGYAEQLNPLFDDGDDADDLAARATLLWEPASNFSVTLRANLYRQDAIGPQRTLLDTRSLVGLTDANGVGYGSVTGAVVIDRCALPGFPEAGGDRRSIFTAYPQSQYLKSNTYSASVEWDVSDAFTLRSITGYTDFVQDRDSTAFPFEPLANNATFDFRTESQTFTQEFNLAYDDGGRFTAVIGAFYLDDDGINLFSEIPNNPRTSVTIESNQVSKTKSYSAFGEANFEIVKGFTLNGGIRYTSDKKEGSSQTRVLIPFAPPIAVPLAAGIKFDSTDFKLGVNWKVSEEVFAYVNYSTAFKTGGVNTGIPVNVIYQPEKIRAWQGGVKAELFNRKLFLNLDAYSYKYKNPQITQVLGVALETQNVESAKVRGFELSADLRPFSGAALSGYVAYADSEYGDGLISDILDLDQFGQTVFGQIQVGGNPLRFTPEWKIGLSPSYTFPVTGTVDLTARADFYWQEDASARPQNLPIDQIDSYTLINATLRANFDDGRYYVELFGRNLTNETIVSARFTNPLNLVEYRPPRTYGVSLGFRFD